MTTAPTNLSAGRSGSSTPAAKMRRTPKKSVSIQFRTFDAYSDGRDGSFRSDATAQSGVTWTGA
ncbi:hypothetical protein [Sorangium sp. So ce542]|uniref:hypothetical protein n=1 Tax=Sorangium sp. So ce542 TaxID=3133316 RepID=UPI003F644854